MSSDSSSRSSSPPTNQPPEPPGGTNTSSLQRNSYERHQPDFYSTTTSNSTKSSTPSETGSDELSSSNVRVAKPSGQNDAYYNSTSKRGAAQSEKTPCQDETNSDESAAAMLAAFQYGLKDETMSRCPTAVSSSISSSMKQESNATISDPLGLLEQSERTASASRPTRQRGNKPKKRRPAAKSEEDLRKERLAANRRSAAVSRQRRKILIEELQNSVSSLVKENASLRRDNDKLKEQLEQLREENRNLASYSSDDESDDSDSPAPTSTDEAQQDLSSQTTFENDQSQQLTAAPTNMAGLGVGLANAGGLLLPQVTNPSLTAIGQGHMYGNASLGQLAGIANPLAFSAGSIQQPQLMGFPFNTQMQLQQFNNSQMQ
eukprot:1705740-Ditylum_brightwellii.AAC.1